LLKITLISYQDPQLPTFYHIDTV